MNPFFMPARGPFVFSTVVIALYTSLTSCIASTAEQVGFPCAICTLYVAVQGYLCDLLDSR